MVTLTNIYKVLSLALYVGLWLDVRTNEILDEKSWTFVLCTNFLICLGTFILILVLELSDPGIVPRKNPDLSYAEE